MAKPSPTRAPRDEILAHLRSLLSEEAVQVAQQVAGLSIAGRKEQALGVLEIFDRKLGGVGLHCPEVQHKRGVYRALFYVFFPLKDSTEPQHHSREMVHAACAYLSTFKTS